MELRNSNSNSKLVLGRSTSNVGSTVNISSSYNNKFRSENNSPDRSKVVWTQPPSKHHTKVPVVYYLSSNGQLQHPHFIEVPLSSSSEGLYLRDVINRLISLRGKAMATMYSWSSKRSYKNGYVWNDLAEDDFIYPAHGNEYVLKGSEILESSKCEESVDSSSKQPPPPPAETSKSSDDSGLPAVITRRRNQSWSAIDLQEYKVVYKAESSGELSSKAADASTQTDDKRRRRRERNEIEETRQTELKREDISSPPPSESSPETLETLMKCDGKIITHSGAGDAIDDLTVNNHSSGRMKASTVLMQLITCGSISFKNSEDHPGLSLMSQYKRGLPRGGRGEKNEVSKSKTVFGNRGGIKEDREYFSGSLVQETNKTDVPTLKRSSSHNAADRIRSSK